MALHDVGVEAESYTGSQAGFLTDTNHTNAKILEVRRRPDPRAPSTPAGCRWWPAPRACRPTATSPSWAGAAPTPPRSRWPRRSDADACELYTDVSGVFTTDPRVVPERPQDAPHLLRRDARDDRRGLPKPAMRSVEYAHRHRVPLHVRSAFTWEPGTWVTEEDPDMEACHHPAVVADDLSEAKVTVAGVPDRPGIAGHAVPRAGRRRHQRRHDRAERVRGRGHRHLLHRAALRAGPGTGDLRGASAPRSAPRR